MTSIVDPGSGGLSDRKGLDKIRTPGSVPQDLPDFLSDQPRFEPRKSETEIIDIIKNEIRDLCGKEFDNLDGITDRLENSVTDAFGSVDWSRLGVEETERGILALQVTLMRLERLASELHVQCQLAYTNWDEAYYEAYSQTASGTIEDKTARARRHSREERYFYLWKYWFWKIVSDRVDQARELRRILDFSINRQYKKPSRQQAYE